MVVAGLVVVQTTTDTTADLERFKIGSVR